MRDYFVQTLGINDSELRRMSWGHIIESVSVNDNALDSPKLAIAQEIMRRDNYVCAMVSDPSLLIWKFPPGAAAPSLIPMSRFFFAWLTLALRGIVLDANGASLVQNAAAPAAAQIEDRLRLRFCLLGLLQLLVFPLMLPFQILYEVYDFAKRLRACGLAFSLRSWSPRAKWLIREYNELPHFFRARLSQSYGSANAYLEHSSEFSMPIARALQFASALLIVLLLLLGLLTDISLVFAAELFLGKSAAWCFAVLVIVYLVSRGVAPDPTKTVESAMLGIERFIHYDFRDEHHSAQSAITRDKVAAFFPPIWAAALAELLGVFVNPFLFLVFLPARAAAIVEFVRKNSVDGGPLGWVSAFATFDVGERGFAGSAGHREKVLRSKRFFDADHESLLPEDEGAMADMALLPRATSPLMRTDFGSNEALSQFGSDLPLGGFSIPSVFGQDL
jgi:autophagy-related protein 9